MWKVLFGGGFFKKVEVWGRQFLEKLFYLMQGEVVFIKNSTNELEWCLYFNNFIKIIFQFQKQTANKFWKCSWNSRKSRIFRYDLWKHPKKGFKMILITFFLVDVTNKKGRKSANNPFKLLVSPWKKKTNRRWDTRTF